MKTNTAPTQGTRKGASLQASQAGSPGHLNIASILSPNPAPEVFIRRPSAGLAHPTLEDGQGGQTMEGTMMSETKSQIHTRNRMSNTGYHANGKPCWWARIGGGDTARFLDIPRVRGDERLVCAVDVPVGTKVYCGAGKGKHKTVRETVITIAIATIAPAPADAAVVEAVPAAVQQ